MFRLLLTLTALTATVPVPDRRAGGCLEVAPEKELRETKFIFAGKVSRIEEERWFIPRHLDSGQVRLNEEAVRYTGRPVVSTIDTFVVMSTAIIEVQDVWKGAVTPKVRVSLNSLGVVSPWALAMFAPDSSVLVFAFKEKNGDYGTSFCSATRQMSYAVEWLQRLGKPRWRAAS